MIEEEYEEKKRDYCRALIGELGHDFIWDTFSRRKR